MGYGKDKGAFHKSSRMEAAMLLENIILNLRRQTMLSQSNGGTR
jgi:hypothetical protein